MSPDQWAVLVALMLASTACLVLASIAATGRRSAHQSDRDL